MIRTVKNIFAVLLFVLPGSFCFQSFAQTYNSALPVHMNGYVLNFGGEILFQPCNDSTRSVWDAMDNTSFALWYFREDLYLEALEQVGDSVLVDFTDTRENKTYPVKLNYFYCSLEVNMMFLDSSYFKVYRQPHYRVHHNGRSYTVKGFAVDNRIIKLVPQRDKDVSEFYRFYSNRGYTVPAWLLDTMKKRQLTY